MASLTYQNVLDLRFLNNRLSDGRFLKNDQDAIDFINLRGLALLGPVQGLPLPSLSEADAGELWPDFSITDRAWQWKEVLPGKKECVYGKLLRHRGTFMSWPIFLSYLRLFGPECDEEEEYARGHLNQSQLRIVETIRVEGAMDSRALWKVFRNGYSGKRKRFVKDLEELQTRLFLTVAGGDLQGWTCHRWDLVERQIPETYLKRMPTFDDAREQLFACFMRNAIACLPREAVSIIRIPHPILEEILVKLPIECINFPDRKGLHWLWNDPKEPCR